MKEQKPNIKWAGLFGLGGETQTYGFEPEVSDRCPSLRSILRCACDSKLFIQSRCYAHHTDLLQQISLHQVSSHVNHELVAIHHPSGTLIEADMLFNLPPKEQYSKSSLPFLFKLFGSGKSLSPGGTVHGLMLGSITKDTM